MMGDGCFNEFNDSLDQVVRAKPLYRSTNTDEIISRDTKNLEFQTLEDSTSIPDS